MGKKALRKSVEQLQKLFDFLGEYGGEIETNEPGIWWTLDLEVEEVYDDKKDILIGVFTDLNGDIMYDPSVKLTIAVKDGRIEEADILEFSNTTVFGTSVVDAEGNIHMNGVTEKAPQGLRGLFEEFMDIIVEVGPYLTKPKNVTKYDKTLAD